MFFKIKLLIEKTPKKRTYSVWVYMLKAHYIYVKIARKITTDGDERKDGKKIK